MARDLFREQLPIIPAKYLKEEFQASSELARVLSIQATAEYGIYHIMAAKVTNKKGQKMKYQSSDEGVSDAYDILRHVAKHFFFSDPCEDNVQGW